MEAWAKPEGNLGSKAINTKLRRGQIWLTISLLIAVGMSCSDVGWEWRMLLFVPFFMAAGGFFQATRKT
ncbi:hypothetical protein JYT28_00980 [Desulfobulbus sp. AH-315-M07]|nr:hypothetical protein [Desulfobulbus sp. AH-315-M07]